MPPKSAKKEAAASGKKRSKQEEDDDDEDGLLKNAGGQWTDSFMVLCALRWSFDQLLRLVSQGQQAAAGTEGGSADGGADIAAKRKKDKAEKSEDPPRPFKEVAIEAVKKNFLPFFLMAALVLTCALIAGGEALDRGNDRREKAPVDDFYGVLGVARDADQSDVKRAYKTLARRWHPDKNPNCTTCQETFSKIATAYETLADEKARGAYDESGGVATDELKSPRSVPLTQDNFDQMVTFSADVWIVQIFKPDDPQCASFHPFWENQIQKNGHLVRFGRVDISKDEGKWLPVKYRALPTILKFSRHLGPPEIFPITQTHDTPAVLMKFVLTSFPNIGLPLHKDPSALKHWLSGSSRRHKVLIAIPGKSEEERYKSHLVTRKLAARWSELFEFRTVETSAVHGLSGVNSLPEEALAALPSKNEATSKAGVLFFAANGDEKLKGSAVLDWPADEEKLVLALLGHAELAAPALSARSAELLCESLAVRRVYCLVLVDPPDNAVIKATQEIKGSRARYADEVNEIRDTGGEVSEDEDNFHVAVVRLYRKNTGLQPSFATCRAPAWGQVETVLDGANAFLMDLDTKRLAPLKGITSFQGIYPQIAYEDSLAWVDDALHPFLSLPDCDETMKENFVREIRIAPFWKLIVHLLTALFLMEALSKAASERSVKWGLGACLLLMLMLLRSPPFVRSFCGYLPAFFFSPTLLAS